jgi:hypothetical protein
MAPSDPGIGLPKQVFDVSDEIGRINASEVEDEFVLFLMKNKAIPHFSFNALGPRLGIIEAVPELPDEEFEKFITGLANVDEMFIFVEPYDMKKGEEGLFKWSIGESTDPTWRMSYKKVTDSRRDVVIACYCNAWKERARSKFGVVFPIASAIGEGMKWKPLYHAK